MREQPLFARASRGASVLWCVTAQLGQHRHLFCGAWGALARVAALLASGAVAWLRACAIPERHVSEPASAADGVGGARARGARHKLGLSSKDVDENSPLVNPMFRDVVPLLRDGVGLPLAQIFVDAKTTVVRPLNRKYASFTLGITATIQALEPRTGRTPEIWAQLAAARVREAAEVAGTFFEARKRMDELLEITGKILPDLEGPDPSIALFSSESAFWKG